jgi:D-sedoheptulose 7-phosphate isomerase
MALEDIRPAFRAIRHSAEITSAIGSFVDAYKDTVLAYVRLLPDDALDPVVDALVAAVVARANTIYVLGNGGSHAIARHLEHTLRQRFTGLHGIRVNCAVDYHSSQSHAVSGGYDSIFESMLRTEQAQAGDLCIFISGSGDSDNLVRAAAYCREHGVRTLSFAGFDGGRISRGRVTDMPFVVRIHDQQISEDIVQVLLHVAADRTYRTCLGGDGDGPGGHAVRRYAARLEASLDQIQPAFLERVSGSVCGAFLAGRAVYLLAPEGAPLSVSAEHIAHNLNWDAVFQVPNPPRRRLHSTPTHCDYSGIGNDRTAPGIVSCQQLAMADPGDVLVVYAQDPASEAVEQAIRMARSAGMTIHCMAGTAGEPAWPGLDAMVFDSDDPDVLADVTQMSGHMLGRVIRMRLLQAVQPGHAIPDMAAYLIGRDLAQRRLIDVQAGL